MEHVSEDWRGALRETILNLRGAMAELEIVHRVAVERLKELDSSASDDRDFSPYKLKG